MRTHCQSMDIQSIELLFIRAAHSGPPRHSPVRHYTAPTKHRSIGQRSARMMSKSPQFPARTSSSARRTGLLQGPLRALAGVLLSVAWLWS
ncbi:MAG TPA: hypothetical protein VIU34_11980, partial [Steroidobacter sp.]